MAKQPVSALVLIHTPEHDVLLLERASHRGYWQSVTGSREGDEAMAETARREVGEETGIDVASFRLIDWHLSNRFEIFQEWRHRYGEGVTHNLEHVFSLQVPGRVPVRLAADEHTAAIWLPWQAAADQVFSWTNRDAILLLGLHGAGGP